MIMTPIHAPIVTDTNPATADLKRALRQTMRAKRASLGPVIRSEASAAVAHKIIALLEPIDAAIPIALHLAKSDEVDLDAVAAHLLRAHRHVVVPCHSATQLTVNPEQGTHEGFAPLRFRAIDAVDNSDAFDVRPGVFGVREPVDGADYLIPPTTIGVFVLPGLAFDPQGYRLGYGGGWFDKALGGWSQDKSHRPLLIGVCFDCQIVEAVPREAHDVRMDRIVTESRLIEIS